MRLKGKPPGPFSFKIGRRIRWIREIQDLSLSQMADRTQMTAQTLARYERGNAVGGLDIPANAIEAIASALNVSPTRLCGPLADFAWLVQEQVGAIEAPLADCQRRDGMTERLDKAIEFHRTNQNDPHGIGNAVIATLVEVRNALSVSDR